MSVVVAAVTNPTVVLTTTRLLVGEEAKFVPSTPTVAPVTAIAGVKPVIVGASEGTTVNAVVLVAEPDGAVTATRPVAAPTGTVTVSWVALADVTAAAVPFTVTVFCDDTALKPVPKIVNVEPTGPLDGEKDNNLTTLVDLVIAVTFPTAS